MAQFLWITMMFEDSLNCKITKSRIRVVGGVLARNSSDA